jgi:hypothetical protein
MHYFSRQSRSSVLVRAQQTHLPGVALGALRPHQDLRQVHLPRQKDEKLKIISSLEFYNNTFVLKDHKID